MIDRAKRSMFRRASVVLTVVFATFVVCMGFCEIGLRVLNIFPDAWPPEFSKYVSAWRDAHEFAHVHGYYQPHSVIPVYADGSVVFGTADDLGYIGTGVPEAEKNHLLVFGDSFAFGYGVKSNATFSACLHAYNAGLWGETFPLHCMAFQRAASAIKPERAIWVLYPPHLISCTPRGWNTWRFFDPHQHPGFAFIINQFNKTKCSSLILKTTGWGYNRSDYYSLEWNLYDASDDSIAPGYACFEKSVVEVLRIAKEEHIQIIPLFVPSKTQVALELRGARPFLYHRSPLKADLATSRMAEILERHGVPKDEQINLMELIRQVPAGWEGYYFKTDAHFNETGHAAVASFLAKRLKEIPLAAENERP